MPSWDNVSKEIDELTSQANASLDIVRRKYLKKFAKTTGRNLIAYYSGWLNNPGISGTEINDLDKNGFMNAIHNMDRNNGLDLFLHTPGGNSAATESLVDYLHRMFGKDIRAFVPQISMSAGTMIACACKSIVMGKQSNLGPIDPQINGIPAKGVIDEFDRAIKAVKDDPGSTPIWQRIIGKYHPSFLGECSRAISWSETMVKRWLTYNMFSEDENPDQKAANVINKFTSHEETFNHAQHINIDDCFDSGLQIEKLEEMKDDLQDQTLTVHHTYIHTFMRSNAVKIIESHKGKAMINFRPNN